VCFGGVYFGGGWGSMKKFGFCLGEGEGEGEGEVGRWKWEDGMGGQGAVGPGVGDGWGGARLMDGVRLRRTSPRGSAKTMRDGRRVDAGKGLPVIDSPADAFAGLLMTAEEALALAEQALSADDLGRAADAGSGVANSRGRFNQLDPTFGRSVRRGRRLPLEVILQ
jgi:hypothetical protein